jgi:hypothetical protein
MPVPARRRVTVYFVTRDYVSKAKETISGTAAPRHTAGFFKYGIVPVQENLRQGARYAAVGSGDTVEAVLPRTFWGFIRDVRFEFGASDRVDFLAGLPQQTWTISDDANELAAYFFTQVPGIADDRRKTVHIAAEALWKALNWQHRHWRRGRQQFPVPLAYVPNGESEAVLHDAVAQHDAGYLLLEGAPGGATLKFTTCAASRMPTKIPANRTAGLVKCRPSLERRRTRPVGCTPQRASHALRVGVRRTGAMCSATVPSHSP